MFFEYLFGAFQRFFFLQMHVSNPSTPNFGQVPVPEDQKKFIDLVVERVETWVRSNSEAEPTLYLERCSPFQRKLIYQALKGKFGQELYTETVDKDKEKVIAVSQVKDLLLLWTIRPFFPHSPLNVQ